MAKTGWQWKGVGKKEESVNGTDDFGFAALPGGYRFCDLPGDYRLIPIEPGDGFEAVGHSGFWWTASRGSDRNDGLAKIYSLDNGSERSREFSVTSYERIDRGYSVRCVEGAGRAGAQIDPRGNTAPPLKDVMTKESRGKVIVGPLLKTQWGELEPYNAMLPKCTAVRGACREVGGLPSAGSEVVAVAQIMKYHNHPKRGKGPAEPGRASLKEYMASEVDYDWGNMLNTYKNVNATEKQRNAAAMLTYHTWLRMNRGRVQEYGWVDDEMRTSRIFWSLQEHISGVLALSGYDKSVQYRSRKFYDDAAWEAIIKEQLDSGLPVLYSSFEDHGSPVFFVVDGYDNNGKFHVNWGNFDGALDGYYSLSALWLGTKLHSAGEYARINIKPDKGGVLGYAPAILNFSLPSKATLRQKEQFSAWFKVMFEGSYNPNIAIRQGLALVDNNGKIAAVMETTDPTGRIYVVPESVKPGLYTMRIAVMPKDGEWSIVTLANRKQNIHNAFSVYIDPPDAPGYDMMLNVFESEKEYAYHNDPFVVSVTVENRGDAFSGGDVGAALTDGGGKIVAAVASYDGNNLSNIYKFAGADANFGFVCKVPNTVPSGKYRLRFAIKPNGKEEWRLPSKHPANTPNSIDFEVK